MRFFFSFFLFFWILLDSCWRISGGVLKAASPTFWGKPQVSCGWYEILNQDELLIFPCSKKNRHILPCCSQGRISFTSSIYDPLPLLWCSSTPHIAFSSLPPSCLPPNCSFCADVVVGFFFFLQMNTFSHMFKRESGLPPAFKPHLENHCYGSLSRAAGSKWQEKKCSKKSLEGYRTGSQKN